MQEEASQVNQIRHPRGGAAEDHPSLHSPLPSPVWALPNPTKPRAETLQSKLGVLVTDRRTEQGWVFYRAPTCQGGAVLVYVLSHFQPR